MSTITDMQDMFNGKTLINKLVSCSEILSTVCVESDLELLSLDEYIFSEFMSNDELTATSYGVNGIPWEMLDSSPEKVELMWKAVYWNRVISYLSSMVKHHDDLIEKYLQREAPKTEESEEAYATFLQTAERFRKNLAEAEEEAARYAKLTDNFEM